MLVQPLGDGGVDEIPPTAPCGDALPGDAEELGDLYVRQSPLGEEPADVTTPYHVVHNGYIT